MQEEKNKDKENYVFNDVHQLPVCEVNITTGTTDFITRNIFFKCSGENSGVALKNLKETMSLYLKYKERL